MFFKHNCQKNGHLYEARYDVFPPEVVKNISCSPIDAVEFVKSMSKKIYVKDVCKFCGAEVKR